MNDNNNTLNNKQKDKCMSNVKATNTRSKLRFTVAPLTSVDLTVAVKTNDFESSVGNEVNGFNTANSKNGQ